VADNEVLDRAIVNARGVLKDALDAVCDLALQDPTINSRLAAMSLCRHLAEEAASVLRMVVREFDDFEDEEVDRLGAHAHRAADRIDVGTTMLGDAVEDFLFNWGVDDEIDSESTPALTLVPPTTTDS
jgi:hypothetical protein